ncbi:MAG: hypothetical protein OXH08_17020 [Gammaproteobacteria bacterium]|nr:hypothetical protein [Gammaproteobacteria bacterium]
MRRRYAVFAALLAACGSESDGESAPPVSEDRALEADFEEVYRIGGIAAEGWDAFTEIADLDFDARGHLYVRDEAGSSTRIVVVDGVGDLAAEFGRMGDGPGELRQVGQMVARPEGGAVLVDTGHRAYLLFSPDGSFERALRFADTGGVRAGSAQIVRSARDGGALFLTRSASASLSQGEASVSSGDRTIYGVALDEREEAVPIPFAEGWEPRPQRQVTIEAADPSDMFAALDGAIAYFDPRLVFDVLPGGGVAYSDSSAFAVKIRTADAPPRVVGRPLHPQAVTDRLRERARTRVLEEYEASVEEQFTTSDLGGDVPEAFRAQFAALMESMLAGMREMVENAAFMPEVPLVRDLRTTWEGTIWVQRWGSDPLAQVEFPGSGLGTDEAADGWIDVLAAEGEYVGTFSLEETPMPAAFGPGGIVAFVETDEFDVPTIIVKRVPEAVR